MALVLKTLYKEYFRCAEELADPRVKGYPLLTSPLMPIGIIAIYLCLVYKVIPKFMESRKPYKMKEIMIVYNISQVIWNATVVYKITRILMKMNMDCNPVDYTYSEDALCVVGVTYAFYLLKVYDLSDTIFIVLKKNTKQASFLHVYHHTGMVIGTYITAKYMAGGEVVFTGYLNAIVHIAMYFYYLLTAINNEWKKNLAAKKFITQLQLIQFFLNILIFGRLLFKPACTFPKAPSYLYVIQNVFMLLLFLDFYRNTYINNKCKKA